jgi:uncharacterized protein YqjF (DUF2071 family)
MRLALRERPQNHSPVMYQKWRELLFLHWAYDPLIIQDTLPPGLSVDTFAGKAYVGLVPFFMRDIRPRFCPVIPGISNFLEVNLRTYVYDERGRAGVWFYSLDANQWLAVQLARTFFKLPYFYAKMQAQISQAGQVSYATWRRGTPDELTSRFRYQGQGSLYQAAPDSLEFFLVERYILFAYAKSQSQLATGQVHHAPYPICAAEVPVWDANLFTLDGLPQPNRAPDHILFSPGVDVEVFALEKAKTLKISC